MVDESDTPDNPEDENPSENQTSDESPDTPDEADNLAEAEAAAATPPPDDGTFNAAGFQQPTIDPVLGDPNGPHPDVELILDVPVTIALEVGRTEMTIGRLLSLSQGAIVELDRLAGEPLDVIVNGALVARGEIVVINDKFGIRLIDIIAPADVNLLEAEHA